MSRVRAKVDIYLGDTLVKTCTCSDLLQDFKVTRVGDTSKFFGFGVIHKLDVKFIDLFRVLSISSENTIEVGIGDGTNFIYPFPTFFVSEVSVDQKTSTIGVTAFDKLYGAKKVTLSEVGINPPYTVRGLAEACAACYGLPISIPTLPDAPFDVLHNEGGNFSGDETLTEVFTAISEVTQTIFCIDANDTLCYKRLSNNGNPVLTITKNDYYELDTKTTRVLTGISSTTELGDNLEAVEDGGVIQYVRNNPLWEMRSDRAALIDAALEANKGLSINQFTCDWNGNYLLEIGDKLAFETDDGTIQAFLLSDILTYSGYLSELTEWEYTADEDETASNPTNLGDMINQTYARVDKLEKNIILHVGEVVDQVVTDRLDDIIDESLEGLVEDVNGLKSSSAIHTTKITQLELTTGEIESTVSAVTNEITNLQSADNTLSGRIETNAEQIGSLSVTVDEINATVSDTQTQVSTLITQVETQDGQIENLETVTETHTEQIGSLQVSTSEITASVSRVESTAKTSVDALEESVQTLTNEVNAKMTTEDVTIAITTTLAEGVDKVVTSTKKYTFDDTGLNIGSTDSPISTVVTEDGMRVHKSGQEVLTANNEGVKAEDLHATTYLIIGDNSRLEDWQNSYTACFWIGG